MYIIRSDLTTSSLIPFKKKLLRTTISFVCTYVGKDLHGNQNINVTTNAILTFECCMILFEVTSSWNYSITASALKFEADLTGPNIPADMKMGLYQLLECIPSGSTCTHSCTTSLYIPASTFSLWIVLQYITLWTCNIFRKLYWRTWRRPLKMIGMMWSHSIST